MSANTQTVTIEVSMSDELLERVERAADENDETVSEFVSRATQFRTDSENTGEIGRLATGSEDLS